MAALVGGKKTNLRCSGCTMASSHDLGMMSPDPPRRDLTGPTSDLTGASARFRGSDESQDRGAAAAV